MKKFNKKGFTLIEMLVVIAIIAVLVSIIIPTVTSATTKAAAATDAANLRSMLAEATTDYLNGKDDDTGLVKYTKTGNKFEPRTGAPVAKSDEVKGKEAIITVDGSGVFTAKFGDDTKSFTLDQFAKVAENGGKLGE